MTDPALVADLCALLGITPAEVQPVLAAAEAGDYRGLRRFGFTINAEVPPEAALALVAELADGQAMAWAQTFDGRRRTVHD